MATLIEDVDATETDWLVSADVPIGTDYLTVEDEIVMISARFPAQLDPQTQQLASTRLRVERGAGGTTAATHANGTTLTPLIPPSSGGGAGGVTIDNQSDPPESITTLVMGAAFGPEGTATITGIFDDDSVTGALAEVTVQATEDNGQAIITAQAIDAVDSGATINATARTAGGAALVSHKAEATGAGTATARLDAELGAGDGEARVAVTAGGVVQAGVVAEFEAGVGAKLLVYDGEAQVGTPGFALIADATFGVQWQAKPQAAAVADLALSVTDPPTQAEVQAVADKVDALLAALRASDQMDT